MIKTWQQRCEEHPDHEGIISEQMIRDRMQEEIDELRQALAEEALDRMVAENQRLGLYDEDNLQTAIEKGTKAWADVPANWVEELRGNDTPQVTPEINEPEWVGLTDDEIAKYWGDAFSGNTQYVQKFARIIEAKLKEKNT